MPDGWMPENTRCMGDGWPMLGGCARRSVGPVVAVLCRVPSWGSKLPTPVEETAMIDMHTHWKPAEVADALRARAREPRILRNGDGVEVLKMPRMGEASLDRAFDDVDVHLHRMDR